MSAAGHFLEALIVFTAQLADVLGRPLFQLGMILFIPGDEGIEGLKLAPAHQFLLGRLGEKAAALAASHYAVNLLDQLIGKDNVCSPVHRCHQSVCGWNGFY